MRKNKVWNRLGKILICTFLIITIMNYSQNIFAQINTNYVEYTLSTDNDNSRNLLSTIADFVLPTIVPFFTIFESLVSKVMGMVTGSNFFPWVDQVIFNAISVLDINFINPSAGSFFMDRYGDETTVGTAVRSLYFSILSICIGFLTIIVIVNVIRMLFSEMAGNRAKYKILINKTLITLVLLFGLHYLIAFIFYLNEQLVVVASTMATNLIGSDTVNSAIQNMNDVSDENNEQLLENFYEDADHTSWWSPVTVAKKVVKELVNVIAKAADWLTSWFSDDSDDDEEVTVYRDDFGNEKFPSKDDYMDYIKNLEDGVDIAAYLLKDYYYRKIRLWSVAGNDSHKFSQEGVWGVAVAVSNTVVWVTGIVDTGLTGLQNLYEDVKYITIDLRNNNFITSANQYSTISEYLTNQANDTSLSEDEREGASLSLTYLNAYWLYVYDGDDKDDTSVASIITSMGTYFKRNIYYTDVDNGDWAPNEFDVIPAVLYCIFVFQSIFYLFSYFKRLLWVVILAMIGPVVVVYDYLTMSF